MAKERENTNDGNHNKGRKEDQKQGGVSSKGVTGPEKKTLGQDPEDDDDHRKAPAPRRGDDGDDALQTKGRDEDQRERGQPDRSAKESKR